MSESSKSLGLSSSGQDESDSYNNWYVLQYLVEEVLEGEKRALVKAMLRRLAYDNKTAEGNLLGMRRAPAAKLHHHAFEGGLVSHYLEMWSAWKTVFKLNKENNHVSDARVLEGIIYHDLHKGFKTYKLVSDSPWKVEYCQDYSEKLMPATIKSIWILMESGIKIDQEQMNALIWSEGGWSLASKITYPKVWCSVLAKLLYLLDEYSGNVLSRADSGTWLDVSQAKTVSS